MFHKDFLAFSSKNPSSGIDTVYTQVQGKSRGVETRTGIGQANLSTVQNLTGRLGVIRSVVQ